MAGRSSIMVQQEEQNMDTIRYDKILLCRDVATDAFESYNNPEFDPFENDKKKLKDNME
jgi:hypothetical protein